MLKKVILSLIGFASLSAMAFDYPCIKIGKRDIGSGIQGYTISGMDENCMFERFKPAICQGAAYNFGANQTPLKSRSASLGSVGLLILMGYPNAPRCKFADINNGSCSADVGICSDIWYLRLTNNVFTKPWDIVKSGQLAASVAANERVVLQRFTQQAGLADQTAAQNIAHEINAELLTAYQNGIASMQQVLGACQPDLQVAAAARLNEGLVVLKDCLSTAASKNAGMVCYNQFHTGFIDDVNTVICKN